MDRNKTFMLGLVVLFWCASAAMADPLEPGFTYQGRLMEGDAPANGPYDIVFVMYDAPEGPNMVGEAGMEEVEVNDGYFTMPVYFEPGLFDGQKRWLQVGVRPGELSEPNEYQWMWPRQEVTPAPYALYAANGGGGGSGTPGRIASFGDEGQLTDSVMFESESKIGVGTVNPRVKLSLGMDLAPKKLALWDGVDDFYGFGVDWGRLIFSTNNTEKMTIRDNGNVGIGTSGPQQRLDVDGGDIIVHGAESFDAPGEEAILYLGSIHHYIKGVYGLGVKLGTYGVGDVLSIRELSGNVGIGTDNPSQKLEVEGNNPRMLVDAVSGNPELNLRAAGRTTWSIYQDASTGNLAFYQAGNKVTVEDVTGNVLIGTGSSSGRLSAVTNEPNGKGVYGEATRTANETNYGGYFVANGMLGHGVYGWGGNIGVVGETSGDNDTGVLGLCSASGVGVKGEAWGVNGTGVEGSGWEADFYASGPGTNYASASSIRWKKDVSPIHEPLEKVMSLRGVHFRWDEAHGGHRDFGMIAEEVGKVLPEIVVYEKNGIDARGMDYGKLTPLLVEAVKELKVEVDELRVERSRKDPTIELLERRNEILERRLSAVESRLQTLIDSGVLEQERAF